MDLPPGVIELENRSVGDSWESTLAEACKILVDAWAAGDRGREVALHLMFLCWYLMLEPEYITGLADGDPLGQRLQPMFTDVYGHWRARIETDAEMLYVVGLMAHLSSWLLGDSDAWEARADEYRALYRQLAPDGLDPEVFSGRGAYGNYFAGQARVLNGY